MAPSRLSNFCKSFDCPVPILTPIPEVPVLKRGIGLLGGTFDPVHNGHLTVALHALEALRLARVEFVPAPAPWQKSVATPVARRIELIEAAIGGIEGLAVNLIEAQRVGKTYTIDTLVELRRLHGPAQPLVLILGADQWENFHTWKNWGAFADYISIALCNRENRVPHAVDEVEALWQGREVAPRDINRSGCGKLTRFTIPAHEASSTKIRELFARLPKNEALKRLESWLPARVARTIARDNIY